MQHIVGRAFIHPIATLPSSAPRAFRARLLDQNSLLSRGQNQRDRMASPPTSGCAAVTEPTAAALELHPDVLSVVFSEQQLQQAAQKMGRQLAVDYADKRPLVVGALTGAFMFTSDLLRCIQPVPEGLTVDFFRASSYGSGTVSGGTVTLSLDGMRSEVEGRHIIVVEDIIDTGATLHAVLARLLQLGAASVNSAVLLNKFERREVDIEPDYWALKCPDEFVVGYGLDFDEKYRSLPYVGVLKPECYAHLGL